MSKNHRPTYQELLKENATLVQALQINGQVNFFTPEGVRVHTPGELKAVFAYGRTEGRKDMATDYNERLFQAMEAASECNASCLAITAIAASGRGALPKEQIRLIVRELAVALGELDQSIRKARSSTLNRINIDQQPFINVYQAAADYSLNDSPADDAHLAKRLMTIVSEQYEFVRPLVEMRDEHGPGPKADPAKVYIANYIHDHRPSNMAYADCGKQLLIEIRGRRNKATVTECDVLSVLTPYENDRKLFGDELRKIYRNNKPAKQSKQVSKKRVN